jgi:hypothetical protein
MHIYTSIYIYIYIYIYIHMYIFICVYTYVYIHISVTSRTPFAQTWYIDIYIYIYICIYIYNSVHIYVCVYDVTYVCIFIPSVVGVAHDHSGLLPGPRYGHSPILNPLQIHSHFPSVTTHSDIKSVVHPLPFPCSIR